MINSALTCEVDKVGSHTMMWRPFITKLLKNLSEWEVGIIYILFGEQAKTLKPYINKNTNIILEEKTSCILRETRWENALYCISRSK